MSSPCTLRLRSDNVKVEFEGEADFVRSCYELIRPKLLEHLTRGLPSTPAAPSSDDENAVVKPVPTRRTPAYVWVLRCNELYYKVSVVERNLLRQSLLGRYLHPGRLARIIVQSDQAEQLHFLVPAGKTLWSELTPAGREQLQSD
jgi:hypothetical protein